MPSAASILDRAAATAHVAHELAGTLDALRDIVDEGTNLLGRVNQTLGNTGSARPMHRSLLLLFRHTIEMADAFAELVRIGAVTPAGLQMRAILEAHMQMLYLLGERSTVAANTLTPNDRPAVPVDPTTGAAAVGQSLNDLLDLRGLAYQVREVRRQVHQLQRYQGGELARWYSEVTGKSQPPATAAAPARQADVTTEIGRLRATLTRADLAPVDAEFTRVRRNAKHDLNWYSVFDGPRTVRDLSRTVGLAFQYDMLYAETSRTMHGTDVLGQLRPANAAGTQAIAPLRELGNAKSLINAFITHMLRIYALVIGELRPSDDIVHASWVQRWIQHIVR
jgi:hypothetical protein